MNKTVSCLNLGMTWWLHKYLIYIQKYNYLKVFEIGSCEISNEGFTFSKLSRAVLMVIMYYVSKKNECFPTGYCIVDPLLHTTLFIHIPLLFVDSSVLYLAVISAFLAFVSFISVSRAWSWDFIKSSSFGMNLSFAVTWKREHKCPEPQSFAKVELKLVVIQYDLHNSYSSILQK